ncbi:hypothetical protein CYMTET_30190 [Cymbomonas tetramitiformis]|uniref:Uncharacterized protein n=1 Tax=Cymbomonas tetramitiformis TaxID=36881 RepID=A0AAE0FJL2_9CHLO|nr:hypothetical protein CYMTET_30190 [Cymbomonas tetramitiformis]
MGTNLTSATHSAHVPSTDSGDAAVQHPWDYHVAAALQRRIRSRAATQPLCSGNHCFSAHGGMACLTASRHNVALAPFLLLFTIASLQLAAGWPQHASFGRSFGRSLAQDESSETEEEVETPTEPKVSHTSGWNGSSVSVLQNFKKFGKLSLKPYPHVIIRPALDPILYRELDATYPSDDRLLTLAGKNEPDRAQNTRVDLKASTSLFSDEVTDLWKRFIDYHVSPEFYREVEKLFAREIAVLHKVKKGYTTALRFGPNTTGANVLMDCQVAINTAVKVKSAVRGPHIDGPAEIYAGLLYFRHHSDQVSKVQKRMLGKS